MIEKILKLRGHSNPKKGAESVQMFWTGDEISEYNMNEVRRALNYARTMFLEEIRMAELQEEHIKAGRDAFNLDEFASLQADLIREKFGSTNAFRGWVNREIDEMIQMAQRGQLIGERMGKFYEVYWGDLSQDYTNIGPSDLWMVDSNVIPDFG